MTSTYAPTIPHCATTVPAGQDGTAGPTAVIQKTCPLIPLPVAYKIDVYAKKGAGSVAVRVYSKPK